MTLLLLAICCSSALRAVTSVTGSVELMGSKFKTYKVTKKESLYALSRNLGVNYDSLLQWNQGFNAEVPKGYTLYLPQLTNNSKPEALPERVLTYKVKYGDTLFGIAKRYNTTVSDIIAVNPKLRSSILAADSEIKVPENTAQRNLVPVLETRRGIVTFRYYEVKRDESAEGIASNHGIDVSLLKAANPGVEIKKNAKLAIPVLGDVHYTVYKAATDPRENTKEGQQAIFDSLANKRVDNHLNVAVVLSSPASNKDIDFARGFLTAVKEFGEVNRHLNISFINGSHESSMLTSDPGLTKASLIFTTYDNKVPESLANYAEKEGKTLINAFAVRDSLFRRNASMINLMSSPNDFNAQVAQYIVENYGDSYFVFLGDPLQAQDQIAFQVMNRLDGENFDAAENLDDVLPHPSRPMVFYSLANNKKSMVDNLEAIKAWMAKNPAVDVRTIGRPSWIVHVSGHKELMKETNTDFPTRFYFADREPAEQQFIKRYEEFFHANPVRSYPTYSVMGYDAAWYFLQPGSEHKDLQMPFRLMRVAGGGEYNSAAYMLRFQPGMPITKLDIIPYSEINE